MNANPLSLPQRSAKPRSEGLTVVIDNGIPAGASRTRSPARRDEIDLVKFGWGTALVTPRLAEKMACLEQHGIGYFFGGTLFEKFVAQDLAEDYFEFCQRSAASTSKSRTAPFTWPRRGRLSSSPARPRSSRS